MGYSPERKESVLKKMLAPENRSIVALAAEEAISEATLYKWRNEARNRGQLMPDSDNTPKGWTSRDKFAAVLETAAMNEEEVAAYCRSKGLYPEQINEWKAACEDANNWKQASEKELKQATQAERKKVKKLKAELERKEKALTEAAALLMLRKKYQALFEEDEDES